MEKTIGIRREDKNEWERRVPLVPDDVRWLKEKHGVRTLIQPSAIRTFRDEEYRRAGAEVSEDLGPAHAVLAVKEIPAELFQEGKTYIFFSHTIKGQPHGMPLLQRVLDSGATLIDYERIVDDHLETGWNCDGRGRSDQQGQHGDDDLPGILCRFTPDHAQRTQRARRGGLCGGWRHRRFGMV